MQNKIWNEDDILNTEYMSVMPLYFLYKLSISQERLSFLNNWTYTTFTYLTVTVTEQINSPITSLRGDNSISIWEPL